MNIDIKINWCSMFAILTLCPILILKYKVNHRIIKRAVNTFKCKNPNNGFVIFSYQLSTETMEN